MFCLTRKGSLSVNVLLLLLPIALMLSAFVPVPSVAFSPPETQPPSATPSQTSEDCMDDGRLVDSALGGVMIALILILTWHIIRLCCCKQKPVQYPPPAPPMASNVATTSVRSSTSVRSNTSARAGASVRPAASERVRESTQRSKTESVRSRTESQKKALGTAGSGTKGTTSSSMRNTGSTR